MRTLIIIIMFCLLMGNGIFGQTIHRSSYSPKIVIVPEGQSRAFMFTNRMGLFYYGETGLPNTSNLNGLSYLTHEYLEDYVIEAAGVPLSRSQAEVHLMGNSLIRYFKKLKLEEEITMVDSLPVLLIKIRSKQKTPLTLIPLISGSTRPQDFVVDWASSEKALFIARKNHLVGNNENNCPIWLGIHTYPEGEFTIAGTEKMVQKFTRTKQKAFCPGKINIYLESEAIILFIIGDNKSNLLKNRNLMLKALNIELKRQNSQIEGVRQVQSLSDQNAGRIVNSNHLDYAHLFNLPISKYLLHFF